LHRTIDRQAGEERADDTGKIYQVGNRASHGHDAQH
jgi:hypothetical protein